MNKIYASPFIFGFLLFTSFLSAQNFSTSGLVGEKLGNPTSLQFGPNGKLYVSVQLGTIWEYTVTRDDAAAGNGTYSVVDAVAINNINTITNHNDDGTAIATMRRQITGIYVGGTAANPVIYASSSDSRQGAAEGGTDSNLDTNSGMLSRLSWNGSGWDLSLIHI